MRFDFHIHSVFSKDSESSIDDILKYATASGLDGVAVCDHNTVRGGLEAIKRVKQLDMPLIVVPGIEVSTSSGHLLVLGTQEDIPPRLSPLETIDKAKQQGGVVIVPHPFRRFASGISDVSSLDIDAIETFNSRYFFDDSNEKARDLSIRLSKPGVGGSDSHLPEAIGMGYTEIPLSPGSSVDDVLDAVRRGRTKACGRKTPLKYIVRQKFKNVWKKLRNKI